MIEQKTQPLGGGHSISVKSLSHVDLPGVPPGCQGLHVIILINR